MTKITKLKCVLIAALFAVMAFVPKANAQEERSNVIKLDMALAAAGVYGFSYERVLGEKTSAQLYVDFMSKSIDGGEGVNVKLGGFSIMPEFRYYVSKKGAPRGFFFGGYIPYRKFDFSADYSKSDNFNGQSVVYTGSAKLPVSFFGIGLVMGPQWLIADRVSLELYWGAAVGSGKLDNPKITAAATDASGNPVIDPSTGQPLVKNVDVELPITNFSFLPRFGLTLGVAF